MKEFLLDIFFVGAALSSVLVITSINPVYSILYLVLLFVSVSCYLILSGIIFLGLAYILVYVGAIAILFLFVVMMLDIKEGENHLNIETEDINRDIPVALAISGSFIYEILAIIKNGNYYIDSFKLLMVDISTNYDQFFNLDYYKSSANTILEMIGFYQQIATLGEGLYTYGGIYLIIISLILLLSMLAPTVLTNYHQQICYPSHY
jgi:NADH-ubiquinone oxidoreductase chain 6